MSGLVERFAFAVDLAVEAGTLALHMQRGLGVRSWNIVGIRSGWLLYSTLIGSNV
jgi:hypothetical protein